MHEIEKVLKEVSRDFAGAHVNADEVLGAVRRRLAEQAPSENRPQTSAQALELMLDCAEGRRGSWHNLIVESSDYGPERFVALARAGTAEVEMWAAVAMGMAAAESRKALLERAGIE